MNILVTVFSVALVILVSWFLLEPFLGKRKNIEHEVNNDLLYLAERREKLLAALADLEYDFRGGKLAEEDYRKSKEELVELVERCSSNLD